MKTRVCSSGLWYLMSSLLVLPGLRPAIGQASFPTVTLYATDPLASEGGLDTGTFTVRRTGPTNFPLIVFYQLSGSASNGVDYEQLGNSVQIPAGALEASFIVKPIDDSLVEGTESVAAELTGSPLACAACGYNIGVPSNAVVLIFDNDGPNATNRPPSVNLSTPANGAVFPAPANILIVASAFDSDGFLTIQTVEFFEGTNSLGVTTNFPTLNPIGPFFVRWTKVPAGAYELTAKATDDHGAMGVSPVVHVFVVETNAVPQPEVNIYAIDDTGSEIPVVPPWLEIPQASDPAVFTVTRTGPTNSPLTVFYSVGGTASNGVDYVGLPGSVIIPAGASSANIEVVVIDDLFVEGTETVELTLQPPVCVQIFPPPPDCYVVGPTDHALAYILDNDLTPPPVVTIVATDPDASESGPDPGTFTVSRTGDTTHPLGVFYTIGGTAQMGVDYLTFSNFVLFPFFISLPDLVIPAGASSADITVTPIDDNLAEGSETVVLQLQQPFWARYIVGVPSNAVVTIADNDTPNATNHPPFVQLNAPQDGDVFAAPADIHLVAFAQDVEDHYNLTVEFFEGTNRLGVGTFNPTRCWPGCPNYILTWSNVPPGEYLLTAKATDHAGASSVSDPVHITVLGSNLLPVVNIVARDPFASEGTNFWLSGWDTNRWAIDIWNFWHVNVGGANTATFVVRRHGPTNDDLTVDYDISGTASNGVDYVALPGSVTIPAGKHSAQIVVAPIDDNLAEGIETVVLQLQPSPAYTVGFPSRASAFIIDNDLPRPPCRLLPDGQFHFCEPATNGSFFRIEASADLRHWMPLCTNVVTDGALHFVDPDAPPLNLRFYRAEPEPGLPPDD